MRIGSSLMAIVLVLLLFLQMNSSIISLWTQCSKWHEVIEQQIEQKLLSTELLSLSLETFEQLHWQKTNKEFWYKGEMYDVVSIEKNNHSVTIKAYKDIFEKKLIQRLLAKFHHTETPNHQTLAKIPFVLYIYLPSTFEWNSEYLDIYLSTFRISQENKPVFLPLSTISPPPEHFA